MNRHTFMWRGEPLTTYGEIGSALCALRDSDEAAAFWHVYVAHLSRPDAVLLGKTPEDVARSNIGYLMGYYSEAERERVYDLLAAFDVSHPFFGRETPTAEQAFETGQRWARGEIEPR